MLWISVFSSSAVYAGIDAKKADQTVQDYMQVLKNIQSLQSQETDLNSQLTVINEQIAQYDQLIGEIQKESEAGDAKIQALENDISGLQTKLNARSKWLDQHLLFLYEDGNVSYLDVLFGSTNFSNFADRVQLLSLILGNDQTLLASLEQDAEKLHLMQDELSNQQKVRSQQQTVLMAAKSDKDKQLAERMQLMANLQQQQQNEEAIAKKEQEEIKAVESDLTPAVLAQLQALEDKTIASAGSWTWPVPASHLVTSGFGPRWGSFHYGIDIGAPVGTPIVAVDNGIVLYAGTASGFGHWVVIKHANGLMSVYGHMYGDEIFVTVGQPVSRGQTIAAVGSDGEATGPHLHFAVATGISGGRMDYVDPNPYLASSFK